MKLKDIAAIYGVDADDFEVYVKQNNLPYNETMLSISVDDNLLPDIVSQYRAQLEKKATAAEAQRQMYEDRRQQMIDHQKQLLDQQQKQIEERQKQLEQMQREAAEKNKILSKISVTTGFNFENSKITKYGGYVTGNDSVYTQLNIAALAATVNAKAQVLQPLTTARYNALRELKESAHNIGCNAVIGLTFDCVALDSPTVNLGGTSAQPHLFCVTANGTAVVIEKEEAAEEN